MVKFVELHAEDANDERVLSSDELDSVVAIETGLLDLDTAWLIFTGDELSINGSQFQS